MLIHSHSQMSSRRIFWMGGFRYGIDKEEKWCSSNYYKCQTCVRFVIHFNRQFLYSRSKNANYPKFETGTKNFKLINDVDNDQNLSTTSAEESYIASGIVEKTQETIISVRNAKVEQNQYLIVDQ